MQARWSASRFTGTYADAKEQSSLFTTYKQTTKRAWVTERQDVATLFGNVQTKLRTYGLREYLPPPGLALSVCIRYVVHLLGSNRVIIRILMTHGKRFSSLKHSGPERSTPRSGSTFVVSDVLYGFMNTTLRIKEKLRKKFAELANGFEQRLHAISSELAAIDGPLEVLTFRS
jgi:hypothetical protein